MRWIEIALAGLCLAGGVRSAWIWGRRPFRGSDLADHLLYAMYLSGRVGLWFAFAGLFAIAASGETGYGWYALLPLALAAMQLVGGQLLGRRSPEEASEEVEDEAPGE